MVNENASLIKYEPPKCDECGRKIVVLSDLCAKCSAGIELNGEKQANRPGTNPLPTRPKPPAPPNPLPAPTNLLGLLKGAFDWIESAPHGDNCFVSDHYDGDPGNRCNCGKDWLLSAYEEFGQPEAPAFSVSEPMPAWMHYDPATDVLTIHGKKYSASLFGNSGFLGNAGDILRIEQGSDDVVKVTKIGPEKSDKFATGGLRKNYIPPIAIRTGLGQNPMKPVPPVPNYSEFQTNNNSLVVALQLAKTEIKSLSSVLGKGLMTDKVLTEINRALGNDTGPA